jgi:hypothetical protein
MLNSVNCYLYKGNLADLPNVCTSGIVVDWYLEHLYLSTMRKIVSLSFLVLFSIFLPKKKKEQHK